jgi:hypothetical protein
VLRRFCDADFADASHAVIQQSRLLHCADWLQ